MPARGACGNERQAPLRSPDAASSQTAQRQGQRARRPLRASWVQAGRTGTFLPCPGDRVWAQARRGSAPRGSEPHACAGLAPAQRCLRSVLRSEPRRAHVQGPCPPPAASAEQGSRVPDLPADGGVQTPARGDADVVPARRGSCAPKPPHRGTFALDRTWPQRRFENGLRRLADARPSLRCREAVGARAGRKQRVQLSAPHPAAPRCLPWAGSRRLPHGPGPCPPPRGRLPRQTAQRARSRPPGLAPSRAHAACLGRCRLMRARVRLGVAGSASLRRALSSSAVAPRREPLPGSGWALPPPLPHFPGPPHPRRAEQPPAAGTVAGPTQRDSKRSRQADSDRGWG